MYNGTYSASKALWPLLLDISCRLCVNSKSAWLSCYFEVAILIVLKVVVVVIRVVVVVVIVVAVVAAVPEVDVAVVVGVVHPKDVLLHLGRVRVGVTLPHHLTT